MQDIKQPPEKRPVGRPSSLDGKHVHVYLDAESVDAAKRIGNGNVSEGIRKALKRAEQSG